MKEENEARRLVANDCVHVADGRYNAYRSFRCQVLTRIGPSVLLRPGYRVSEERRRSTGVFMGGYFCCNFNVEWHVFF